MVLGDRMRAKQQQKARHDDLFRARLDQIINMKHELVVLADRIGRVWLDAQLAKSYSDQGRSAEPVRFMIDMFLLKHTYARGNPRDYLRSVRLIWRSRPIASSAKVYINRARGRDGGQRRRRVTGPEGAPKPEPP